METFQDWRLRSGWEQGIHVSDDGRFDFWNVLQSIHVFLSNSSIFLETFFNKFFFLSLVDNMVDKLS